MNWPNRTFLHGVARASGRALVFAIPMLMTLEMWALGDAAAPPGALLDAEAIEESAVTFRLHRAAVEGTRRPLFLGPIASG